MMCGCICIEPLLLCSWVNSYFPDDLSLDTLMSLIAINSITPLHTTSIFLRSPRTHPVSVQLSSVQFNMLPRCSGKPTRVPLCFSAFPPCCL